MKSFDRSTVVLLGLALTLCGWVRVADQPDVGPPPAKARVEAGVLVGQRLGRADLIRLRER